MKKITIREAQHNLAKVLHEVEAGETVEIVRRKEPVARLIPIPPTPGADHPVDWSGHAALMASVWREAEIEAATLCGLRVVDPGEGKGRGRG